MEICNRISRLNKGIRVEVLKETPIPVAAVVITVVAVGGVADAGEAINISSITNQVFV